MVCCGALQYRGDPPARLPRAGHALEKLNFFLRVDLAARAVLGRSVRIYCGRETLWTSRLNSVGHNMASCASVKTPTRFIVRQSSMAAGTCITVQYCMPVSRSLTKGARYSISGLSGPG